MRAALALLLILLPGLASAQPYGLGASWGERPSRACCVLDWMTTPATAAYSQRQMRAAYTGPLDLVRRASDNTQVAISQWNHRLNIGQLLSFCAGTTCYVATWSDQSGNGYDDTQTTASFQPTIVNSGALQTMGSRPAVLFNTAGNSNPIFFNQPDSLTPSGTQPIYMSMVGSVNWYQSGGLTTAPLWFGGQGSGVSGGRGFIVQGDSTSTQVLYSDNITNSQVRSASIAQGANFLASADFDGANLTGYLNGVSQGTTGDTLVAGGASSSNRLGQNLSAAYWPGTIGEVVIINSASPRSAQAALELNEVNYFGLSQ